MLTCARCGGYVFVSGWGTTCINCARSPSHEEEQKTAEVVVAYERSASRIRMPSHAGENL